MGNYVSLRLDPGGKILIIFEIEMFSKEEPPLLLFTRLFVSVAGAALPWLLTSVIPVPGARMASADLHGH